MIPKTIVFGLTLTAVLAASAPAQDRPPPARGDDPSGSGAGSLRGNPDRKQMYEDIEVMRRLVSKNLHGFSVTDCLKCHTPAAGAGMGSFDDFTGRLHHLHAAGGGSGMPLMPGMPPHHPGEAQPPAVEGTYLKGHGAVFHVTLPPIAHLTPAAPSRTVGVSLTEWERVRIQVRGEKAPPQPGATHPPALSEVLLKLLADNGRNFGQLAANEAVTLVVTFRKEAGTGAAPAGMMSAPGMTGPGSGGMGPMIPGGGGMPGAVEGSGGASGASSSGVPSSPGLPGGSGVPSGPGTGAPGMPGAPPGPGGMGTPGMPGTPGGSGSSAVRDYELLAELHRKQGNWKEVARVYEDALRKRPKDQDKDVTIKLAAALLELGQLERARQLLAQIASKPGSPSNPAGPPNVPKDALPLKFIVGAPKSLLDQVGSGKISFEEFAKKASIETVPAGK